MNQHVENVKKLLDGAIKGGLFPNAESVEICSRSVKEIAVMVGEYERMTSQKTPDKKQVNVAEKTNGQTQPH
jgi:hypothetical protein